MHHRDGNGSLARLLPQDRAQVSMAPTAQFSAPESTSAFGSHAGRGQRRAFSHTQVSHGTGRLVILPSLLPESVLTSN